MTMWNLFPIPDYTHLGMMFKLMCLGGALPRFVDSNLNASVHNTKLVIERTLSVNVLVNE